MAGKRNVKGCVECIDEPIPPIWPAFHPTSGGRRRGQQGLPAFLAWMLHIPRGQRKTRQLLAQTSTRCGRWPHHGSFNSSLGPITLRPVALTVSTRGERTWFRSSARPAGVVASSTSAEDPGSAPMPEPEAAPPGVLPRTPRSSARRWPTSSPSLLIPSLRRAKLTTSTASTIASRDTITAQHVVVPLGVRTVLALWFGAAGSS